MVEFKLAEIPELIFGYRGIVFSLSEDFKPIRIYKNTDGVLCGQESLDIECFKKTIDMIIACDAWSPQYNINGDDLNPEFIQETKNSIKIIRLR